MLSFEQLLFEAEAISEEGIEEYLEDFFRPDHFPVYIIDEKASKDERSDIEDLFVSPYPLYERARSIYERGNRCQEAFYVLLRIGDELEAYSLMKEEYRQMDRYEEFSPYQQLCYQNILNFYLQYLSDIHNITAAIRVLKALIDLKGKASVLDIDRLSYLYGLIENKDDFYELYLSGAFQDAIPYLLLLVVLLKHGEDLKAKEVLSEMIARYPYSDYIDHIWDLDGSEDPSAIEFRESCDACYEEILAVPYFFAWCAENKERTFAS